MAISYVIGGVLIAIGALALIRYVKNGESPALRNELDIVYKNINVLYVLEFQRFIYRGIPYNNYSFSIFLDKKVRLV